MIHHHYTMAIINLTAGICEKVGIEILIDLSTIIQYSSANPKHEAALRVVEAMSKTPDNFCPSNINEHLFPLD